MNLIKELKKNLSNLVKIRFLTKKHITGIEKVRPNTIPIGDFFMLRFEPKQLSFHSV